MKQRIIFLLCLVLANHLSAQVYKDPCDTTLLTVQIPKKAFNDRTKLFTGLGGKQSVLPTVLGSIQPEASTGYEINEFFSTLTELMDKGDGIRIYFAAFTETGTVDADMPYLDKRINQLVPIFVPTQEVEINGYAVNNNVPDIFYIPDVLKKKGLRQISAATARAWIKNYVDVFLPKLKKTLPSTYTEGDTKELWYNKKDLIAWRDEMLCQHKRVNANVDEIHLFWATYESNYSFLTGVANPTSTRTLFTKGRLTLLFQVPNAIVVTKAIRQSQFKKQFLALKKEYTDKLSLKGITSKKKALYKTLLSKLLLWDPSGEYDTGVPCPPADNCVEP